jgi:predicted nuclease of restriction endonuclease-like RecB superfamily
LILPHELIRVRRTKAALTPLYADDEKLGLAKTLITIYAENRDRKRSELNEGIAVCEELGYDFKLVRGLSAVLDSHCIFGARSFVPPVKARRLLFEESAKRPSISVRDRAEIFEKVAEGLGVASLDLEESLYADLLDEQYLIDFKEPTPDELLKLYNFSLVSMILAYSIHIAISYSGRNEGLERAAKALGETEVRVSSLSIDLKPSRQVGLRGGKCESLLTLLIESRNWSLRADVAYPPRHHETRPLELNQRTSGGMLKAEPMVEETIIEIKASSRKSSLGDPIVIDDVANRLGLTDKEVLKMVEAEKVRYIRLPGVLVTQEKLETLRAGLEEIEGDDLALYKAFLKGQGCKNPTPVLEALGYFVEIDAETRKPRVARLHSKASS